ncbi:E3 ubiquitin/ISG15 ligase TRIM25 [Colossoma macropomum]|uniref:E3 ubiquitin/ISG15 ligase TRIM25 n=1 Tax=Colossoma macropomum TaxID=42526 RepID=UPI001864C0DD|nr:E3 ubiquitin/ISG15 ligase TRIM25 [Colossoma macropomum]
MGSMDEELTCPMCRDLFGPAYPLPCGHSFCPNCVWEMWGQTQGSSSSRGRFACPQCQEDHGVVVCDCCPEEGEGGLACPAVKSCMRCEVSLCEQHLQPHLQFPAYSTHLLVEPLIDMSRRRCPAHQEVFRYYCLDDREYICADCILEGSHAQHQVKGLRKLEEDYKDTLQALLQQAEEKIKCGEKILQEHEKSSSTIISSSMADDSQVVWLGSALQNQVDRLVAALRNANEQERQQAIDQLQEDFSRVKGGLEKTESIYHYLGSLLRETDPFLLIWAFQTENSKLVDDLNSPLFTPVLPSFDKKRTLEHVEQKYREFISETLRCLIELKRDLLSSPLTLDTNSAHPLLNVSDDLRSVMRVKHRLPNSDHPDRFDHWSQVVTNQTFSSGTHYWELEAEGFWDIAITYHSIERKGKEGTAFGCNKVSWSLTQQHDRKLAAWHNRKKTRLSAKMSGNRLAVSLDYTSGSITFSEVGPSSALRPLYNFSTSFSQPVCLGFGLYKPELNSRISILRKT